MPRHAENAEVKRCNKAPAHTSIRHSDLILSLHNRSRPQARLCTGVQCSIAFTTYGYVGEGLYKSPTSFCAFVTHSDVLCSSAGAPK
jgi:hypothetical protein